MLDPAMELLPPLSSPTISSISSSDLDTESTGSFFHDRSTTLGTLMGVATTFPTITFRVPSQRRDGTAAGGSVVTLGGSGATNCSSVRFGERRRRRMVNDAVDLVSERRRKRLKRRRWWWLCSGEDLKPSSLGEFLEVERRFGEEALFGGEAAVNMQVSSQENGGSTLFADGRVLPPPQSQPVPEPEPPSSDADEGTTSVCSLCRFPVSLAGICSGGAG